MDKKIKEDTVSVGAMNGVGGASINGAPPNPANIDGIGVGPDREPGVDRKKKLRIIAPMLKRKGQ